MKVEVRKLGENEVRAMYPITDAIPGWFFRIREISAGIWVLRMFAVKYSMNRRAA